MFYISRGEIPKKRHSQYRKKDNSLFIEEHVSREGFSSIYSNLYHNQMPTEITSIGQFHETQILSANGKHKNRHYFTSSLELSGNIVDSRRLLFFNDDILIYKSHCNNDMNFMYRNSHFDEIIYVQSGEGVFQSNFGNITFEVQDCEIDNISEQFIPCDSFVCYSFITPWIALNHMTNGKYQSLTNEEKPSYLNAGPIVMTVQKKVRN